MRATLARVQNELFDFDVARGPVEEDGRRLRIVQRR